MELDERAFAESLVELVKVGVEAERERCALIAEEQAFAWVNGDASTVYGQAYQAACRVVARAIRHPVGTAQLTEGK